MRPSRKRASLQPSDAAAAAAAEDDDEVETKKRRSSLGADIDVKEQRRRAAEWRDSNLKTLKKSAGKEGAGEAAAADKEEEEDQDEAEDAKEKRTREADTKATSKRPRKSATTASTTTSSNLDSESDVGSTRGRGRRAQKDAAEAETARSSTPPTLPAEDTAPPSSARSSRKRTSIVPSLTQAIEAGKAERKSRLSAIAEDEVVSRLSTAPSTQPSVVSSPLQTSSSPTLSQAAPPTIAPLPQAPAADASTSAATTEVAASTTYVYRSHLYRDDSPSAALIFGRVVTFVVIAYLFSNDVNDGLLASGLAIVLSVLRRMHRHLYD